MKRWAGRGVGLVGLLALASSAAAQEPSATANDSAETVAPASTEATPPSEPEPAIEEGAPPSEGPPPVADVTAQPEDPTFPELDGSGESSGEPTYSLPPPPSAPPKIPTPFDQGSIRLGLVLGWAQASTGLSTINWVLLGVTGGYYVLDGLEPNLGANFWIGDPFIATLSPGLNYVFHMVPTVKPYVGAFYRHYFVTDNRFGWDDTDSIGARGGVYFMIGPMSYFGGGIAYEHFLDQNLFSNVDQVYPEITLAIAF